VGSLPVVVVCVLVLDVLSHGHCDSEVFGSSSLCGCRFEWEEAVVYLDLKEVFRRAIYFLEGLVSRLWHGLHLARKAGGVGIDADSGRLPRGRNEGEVNAVLGVCTSGVMAVTVVGQREKSLLFLVQ
jgi:hypothetical protein